MHNEMSDRNIVFEAHDQVEAAVIQSMLESHDIEVFAYKETLSGMYGFCSPTIGKISLGVRDEDAQKARDTIKSCSGKAGGENQV